MINIKSIFIFIVCLGVAFGFTVTCADKVTLTIKKVQYIKVEDSTKVIELKNLLRLTQDSLNVYKNDTLISETEFTLRYKLERIRYYNECAGKGNNVIFLRGWINRVLNE